MLERVLPTDVEEAEGDRGEKREEGNGRSRMGRGDDEHMGMMGKWEGDEEAGGGRERQGPLIACVDQLLIDTTTNKNTKSKETVSRTTKISIN